MGLGTDTAIVRGALAGIREIEGTDAGTMADRAVDIKLTSALIALVGLVDRLVSIMFVLMMSHMLRLRRRTLMHAIGSYRRPAELER
ncbi:hypothetical protein ASE28_21840 [Acidovorax sp. Root219]|nr:hypothetical protein [Acidovorax sp. Root219]KRC26332.1 hypothetical protein ASE28_21840 [Acidovorax sp. Root219]